MLGSADLQQTLRLPSPLYLPVKKSWRIIQEALIFLQQQKNASVARSQEKWILWTRAEKALCRHPYTWRQGATSGSNKPSEMLLTQRTYEYLLEHTQEDQALQDLRQSTLDVWPKAKQMQVSPELGRFLTWLVATLGAKKAIELGVFTGYSAICIAKGLSSEGMLVACESDERPLTLAEQAFNAAGVSNKIHLSRGKAAATLQSLMQEGQGNTFDFAFVDADKRGYASYHEALLQLIRPGGIIVYDNMLWYGAVADPQDQRKSTEAIRSFNAQLMHDTRLDVSLVQIGDGIALCRKL